MLAQERSITFARPNLLGYSGRAMVKRWAASESSVGAYLVPSGNTFEMLMNSLKAARKSNLGCKQMHIIVCECISVGGKHGGKK